MKCQYCGCTDNLVWTSYFDEEDGLRYDEPDDCCHDCVEIAGKRSRINAEWQHYEGMSAPEIELPQYPKRNTTE